LDITSIIVPVILFFAQFSYFESQKRKDSKMIPYLIFYNKEIKNIGNSPAVNIMVFKLLKYPIPPNNEMYITPEKFISNLQINDAENYIRKLFHHGVGEKIIIQYQNLQGKTFHLITDNVYMSGEPSKITTPKVVANRNKFKSFQLFNKGDFPNKAYLLKILDVKLSIKILKTKINIDRSIT
jgi:hypothetical protein